MTALLERPAGPRTDVRPLVPAACLRAGRVVAGLLAVAAAAGLLGGYDAETAFARGGFQGADVVSLGLGVPLLAWSSRAAARGSVRGTLLWLGGLGYVTYQYGYVFAYSWSRLFPAYLALLVLSAYTLVTALLALDARAVAARFAAGTPVLGVARFLVVLAAGLGVMEGAQIVAAVVTGEPPEIVTLSGHPTSPVYVLDLGLVVPLLWLSARWLRDRRPWGYVAAAVLLVKGVTVGLGLLAGNVFALLDDRATDGPLNALWAFIAVGSAYALWRLLRSVR